MPLPKNKANRRMITKRSVTEGSNAGGGSISNLADPTNDQDAATKKYVDDEIDGLAPLFGTDNQDLTFNTTTKKLSIEDGNEVDLSSLAGGGGKYGSAYWSDAGR